MQGVLNFCVALCIIVPAIAVIVLIKRISAFPKKSEHNGEDQRLECMKIAQQSENKKSQDSVTDKTDSIDKM
ncbi:MAG: hypothetical protein Q4F95_10565 [Oscillospiraceae bacterium]|nr:hypothetical protein [Oscillospiraceae bacterium]